MTSSCFARTSKQVLAHVFEHEQIVIDDLACFGHVQYFQCFPIFVSPSSFLLCVYTHFQAEPIYPCLLANAKRHSNICLDSAAAMSTVANVEENQAWTKNMTLPSNFHSRIGDVSGFQQF
jgi:hypothetical protein